MSILDFAKNIVNHQSNRDKSNASLWNGFNNLFTGNLDYQRQLEMLEKQQSFNANEAQKTRDWNERLANTAYQRQAQDLKASGFNPALILSGSGASGYTSASASSSAPSGKTNAGQGYSMLAKIGLTLAGQAMSALALSSRTNSNLSSALNSREYTQQMLIPKTWKALPYNTKLIENKFVDQDDLNDFFNQFKK